MQPRKKLVLEFWDRSSQLTLKNREYRDFARRFFSLLLESDAERGDLTTGLLAKKNKKISAIIKAKEEGIIAGLEEFKFLNKGLKIKLLKKDGAVIKKRDIIAEISGNQDVILSRERTSLNLLQRMSGIATLTNRLGKRLRNAKIAATRKTLWGLLDKKAVSIGGGLTHRLNLNDGIIVKDNHLGLFNHDFKRIINLVKNKSRFIEVEAEGMKQALGAAAAIKDIVGKSKIKKNLFAIMLDNIKPDGIKSIVRELKKQGLYDYVSLEASGGINPGNLQLYSDCGVDVVSMGCITNSAKALDMSQEIK